LIRLGAGSDRIIAILLDRSPEMIIAMLAVLKAGAAYLPLDPDYPCDRLKFMLQDSHAYCLLSTLGQYQKLAESGGKLPDTINLDEADLIEELNLLSGNQIAQTERIYPLESQHLAYLIYTSGSTGTPKGAGNTHHALVNRLKWMQSELQLNETDKILQKTGIGFDVAVWEWFLPLMTGATLVIARPGGQKDPEYLKCMIEKHDVTVMHFVPSMLSIFLDSIEQGDCPTIKQLVTSGEALNGGLMSEVFQRSPTAHREAETAKAHRG